MSKNPNYHDIVEVIVSIAFVALAYYIIVIY
jgi:hypothetical protein